MRPFHDLIRHSAVYGVGQVLSRLASVLLLPLYTHALTPADYGRVAILDLVTGVLAVLIGSEMSSAQCRFHFEARDETERDAVWWTGLTFVAGTAACIAAPLWLVRDELARLTLGEVSGEAGLYYGLALATLWFGAVGQMLEAYTRVRKWSGLYIAVSLGRLLLNVGLNVYFLVVRRMGIAGLLTGNLIAAAAFTLILLAIFAASRGRFRFDRRLLAAQMRFAGPLVAISLLSLLMHEADRYLLRTLVDMEQVGVYALAYKVGQAINTLCLMPFGAIWGVVVYEVASLPEARRIYADVFRHFTSGLIVLMLGAAVAAGPVLAWLTPAGYHDAVNLVPVILLAYVLFNLHAQFSVPALIAKRTLVLVPGALTGVATNIGLNLLLIPRFGAAGAAWASVATYGAFSLVTLVLCRRIERYPYAFKTFGAALAGAGLTFVAIRATCADRMDGPAMFMVATGAAGAWGLVLFGPTAWSWAACRSTAPRAPERPISQAVGN